MSEHAARMARETRLAIEREKAIEERTMMLASLASIVFRSGLGVRDAIDVAGAILAEAKRAAERQVDAEAKG